MPRIDSFLPSVLLSGRPIQARTHDTTPATAKDDAVFTMSTPLLPKSKKVERECTVARPAVKRVLATQRGSLVEWKTYQVPSKYKVTAHVQSLGDPGPPSPGLSTSLSSTLSSSDSTPLATPDPTAQSFPSIVIPSSPLPPRHNSTESIATSDLVFDRHEPRLRTRPVLSKQLSTSYASSHEEVEEPRSPYAPSDKQDNRLITVEAGLASLAWRINLPDPTVSTYPPSLRHHDSSGPAIFGYPSSASRTAVRRVSSARRSSSAWRPHAFVAAAGHDKTTGDTPDVDPFAHAGVPFYADWEEEPRRENIYDFSVYATPPPNTRRLPIYERWARRVRSLPRLRRPLHDDARDENKQQRRTAEIAALDAKRRRTHERDAKPPVQPVSKGPDVRPRAKSLGAIPFLRRKGDEGALAAVPAVERTGSVGNGNRSIAGDKLSTHAVRTVHAQSETRKTGPPEQHPRPTRPTRLVFEFQNGPASASPGPDTQTSPITFAPSQAREAEQELHRRPAEADAKPKLPSQFRPLLLVQKREYEERGDKRRSRQIDEIIGLLGRNRSAAATVGAIVISGVALYATGKSARAEEKNNSVYGTGAPSENMTSGEVQAELHKKPMVPGLVGDYVDELPAGLGYLPPATGCPIERTSPALDVLRAAQNLFLPTLSSNPPPILQAIMLCAALTPLVVRLFGIMHNRRVAAENASTAAALIAQLEKQVAPEDPRAAFTLSTALNISSALARDAESAMHGPALVTQLCWLSGISVGLVTAVSAAALPWMSRHGLSYIRLIRAIRGIRIGLWVTLCLYAMGFLDLVRVLGLGRGADPLLLVVCITSFAILLYAASTSLSIRLWKDTEPPPDSG
ncbi:hypothetical protein K488DRAFT_82373 [Vararia minispora EC-137]|uniref:Uncharacterized protein n=1 Tax=Vararia minispora EC-137 TaxID=1314806 RepID=A0ACB8QWS6_9AGAM|nr:hypothetical protein K488DRAFT_82373 [Vararia minispora EC-137]